MKDIETSARSILSRGNVSLGSLTKGIAKGVSSITNPVEKLLGVKGPMYTIGYVALEQNEENRFLNEGLIRGLFRAVQNVVDVFSEQGAGFALQNGTTVDGFFRFEGDMGVSLPSYPIQMGSNINMQRVRMPDSLSMEIFVSAWDTDDIAEKTAQIVTNDALVSLVTGVSGGQARIRRKLNELRWLNQAGRPFKLYTPHCVYENMLLKRIRPKNDEQTMDGWSGILDFQEAIYYADVSDTTSRKSKKALSSAASGILNKFTQVL